MKKNVYIVLPPLRALLGHPVQNIFFALIQKSFYKPLLKFFLDIINFCFGTPIQKNEVGKNFTY